MSLNENGSREEILSYIKNSPFSFLYNFSYDIWAQHYIDEAAKIAAKLDPYRFLNYFTDRVWAQPYIDEAVKEAAKKDPELFLKKWADKYPQGINWALFALGGKNVAK